MTIQEFYHSNTWYNCAKAYRSKAGGLCERCYANGIVTPGIEVHHKIHLTPANVSDPNIATNFDNLILLCPSCHEAMHKKVEKRFVVDQKTGAISPVQKKDNGVENTPCAQQKNREWVLCEGVDYAK